MIALALPAQDSGEFTPPGIEELHLPAILPWGAADGFSKQMLLVILSVVIIATFFLLAARKQQLVPGKLQFAGEAAYGFVRNSIAKDIIGGKDFMKYVPLLFSLFFFILVNNIYGAIPVIQLPSFSHVGGAYVLAAIVYVLESGCAWRKLPGSFPVHWRTAHRRCAEWVTAGVMTALHQATLDVLGTAGQIDWSRASIDSMHVRAVKRGT